jgi:hypothetical protein
VSIPAFVNNDMASPSSKQAPGPAQAPSPTAAGVSAAAPPHSGHGRRTSGIRRSRPSYSCESCRTRRVKCDQVGGIFLPHEPACVTSWRPLCLCSYASRSYAQNARTVLEMRSIVSTERRIGSGRRIQMENSKMSLLRKQCVAPLRPMRSNLTRAIF